MGSAMPGQPAKLSKFPSTTPGLLPTASPLAPWSQHRPPAEADDDASFQEGAGAWDLTSDALSAFRVLTVFPNRLPDQARTHDDVPMKWLSTFQWRKSIRRHALPWQGLPSLRSPSSADLDAPLFAEHCQSTLTPKTLRLVAALGCKPRTSTTYPLPLGTRQRYTN
jgi:hypothetical protein